MAAAGTASVNMAAAVPISSCALSSSCSSDSSAHISSSANFGGMRLNAATAAAPSSVSRPSRTFVVRAGEQSSIWESITGLFGGGKKKASEALAQGEKELNKSTGEAKSASGDFGKKAESFKEESQAKLDEAAGKVKTGVEDLKAKTEEAVESAKPK